MIPYQPNLALPPGTLFKLGRAAGLEFRSDREKAAVRCPFHEDRTASAFLTHTTNCFYCSVCTPEGGWSAKAFAQAARVPWPPTELVQPPAAIVRHPTSTDTPAFPPESAEAIWKSALAYARSDASAQEAADVYEYLQRRGLQDAWEYSAFGILARHGQPPPHVGSWVRGGYRLIAPLFDQTASLVCVQGRRTNGGTPKVMTPSGGRILGSSFASEAGLEVLRRTWQGPKRLLLGEGLTDHLALTVACPIPLLGAPGTNVAVAVLGPWVEGYEVFVALDADDAGHAAAQRVAERAVGYGAKRALRVKWPGKHKDACDVVAERGIGGLYEFFDKLPEVRP